MNRLMRLRGVVSSVLGLVLVLAMVAPATAATFGFYNITNNSPEIGSQLFVDVTAEGSTGARFAFRNEGPTASSITDVYFANSPLLFDLAKTTIVNTSGVNFGAKAAPPGLPGGGSFGLDNKSVVFSADSEEPIPANGVNIGETLAIVIALAGSNDFGDVLSALFANSLRIGIHVQGISGGNSDSYVAATPLPGALALFATGLVSLLGFLRRQKKRNLVTA